MIWILYKCPFFFTLKMVACIILLVIDMNIRIHGEAYEVIVIKKRIKNTYIRVKSDLKIYVSTGLFSSKKYIEELIINNESSIYKMIEREKKKIVKSNKFYYLGNEYNVIKVNTFKKPIIDGNNIFVKDEKARDKFLFDEARRILPLRVKECYNNINADIPLPKVVVRKMVRKWGHCNKAKCIVTLNSELIKYDIDDIDYVVIHELVHLIHFNHSKAFWDTVQFYKPNYKENKKRLKEE